MIGSSGTTSRPASNPMRCPNRGGANRLLIGRGVYQRSKRGQIAPIGFVLDFFRRFQKLGNPAEPRIIQQESKSVEAETSVTDVFVAIDARSEVLLRIVEVKNSDVANADLPVELLDRTLVCVASAEVVTGCEDVAGI